MIDGGNMEEMKERKFVQEFTNKKKEFSYDEDLQELKEVGVIDVDKQIQSVEYTHIDKLFNKFLMTGEDTSVLEYRADNLGKTYTNPMVEKEKYLESVGNVYAELEEIRAKNGISADVSYTDMLKEFQIKANVYDDLVKKASAKKNSESKVEGDSQDEVEKKSINA